jgi:hypothetical protein
VPAPGLGIGVRPSDDSGRLKHLSPQFLYLRSQKEILANLRPMGELDGNRKALPGLGIGRPAVASDGRCARWQSFAFLPRRRKYRHPRSQRAAFRSSQTPDNGDAAPLARALISANSDRIVWGTDWPHPHSVTPSGRKPTEVTPLLEIDDGRLFNQAPVWAPDAAIRKCGFWSIIRRGYMAFQGMA